MFCYGTPEEMLHVFADSLCALGNNNMHVMAQTLVTLNPLNAEEFARRGRTKQDVRQYLRGHARRRLADVRACGVVHEQFRTMERDAGRYPLRYDLDNPTTRLPVTATPEDIHIVVAGGRSYFAAVLPGTTHLGSLLVERRGAKVERLVTPSGTAPSPPDLLDVAATAQVAIVGIGL